MTFPRSAALLGAMGLGVLLLVLGWWWFRRARGDAGAGGGRGEDTEPGQPDTHPADVKEGRGRTRYVIEGEIARGAMGSVFAAREATSGRRIALKTMTLPGRTDLQMRHAERERFQREVDAAARLIHPDIVRVFDAGHDDEQAWMAMELVPGFDLSTRAAPGQLLDTRLVLRIGARVARALAYAHRQGVVHRDIKPANIMVDLAGGRVKITDFGTAHLGDASRTRTGVVLGTPSFMAPEQMAGSRVDGRADLYSLGAMLFQLLTGRLPFEADSMARLISAIANDPAPDLRALRPDLPVALTAVVALALEKRPELRYADGDQMANDLQAVEALLETPGLRDAVPIDAAPGSGTADPRQNAPR